MNSATFITFLIFALSLYLAIRARRGKEMNLEQWAAGGRSFGTLFIFILMAGEFYTMFSLLGASGWAYGKGGPAYHILAYLSLGFALYYFIHPIIWKAGKEKGLITQADFMSSQYSSPLLGLIAALLGVFAMLPYLVVQLKGLSIVIAYTSYGLISPTLAMLIASIAMVVYVLLSGIHGSAWTAILKDIMILSVIVFLGIYLPFHYYGGIGDMFRQIADARPDFLLLPPQGLSISWLISTVLINVIGALMWPHLYPPIYAARNPRSFRKNSVIAPLYTLMLLFALFVGFAAIMQVPGLQGGEVDLALIKLSVQTFPPWLIGIIGATGFLTALVPSTLLLIATTTQIVNNIFKYFRPRTTNAQVANGSKLLVPLLMIVVLGVALNAGESLVVLLLIGYSLISQLAPAMLLSLPQKRWVTAEGAIAGMVVGMGLVIYITLSKVTFKQLFPDLPAAIQDLNIGVLGISVNLLVMLVVSRLTRKPVVQQLSVT
ncbi:MAG: sodium:solute symporter family protein [Enterobacteriaceae bacterium]